MKSEPATSFAPFADDETAITLGDFNIENGTERIVLHGSIEIGRTAAGLRQAKVLRELLDSIVLHIEAGQAPAVAPGAADGTKSRAKKA